MTSRSTPSAFLKSVLQNGVGRYVCQLQRITFLFSKVSARSRGVRDFIEQDLVDFARKNPGIAVYVKPDAQYANALLVTEYLNGTKRDVDCTGANRETILKQVELARTQSGLDVVRLRKWMHTDNPTIQGLWTPFTNKPTHLNVETFPSTNPTWKYADRKPTLNLETDNGDTPSSS